MSDLWGIDSSNNIIESLDSNSFQFTSKDLMSIDLSETILIKFNLIDPTLLIILKFKQYFYELFIATAVVAIVMSFIKLIYSEKKFRHCSSNINFRKRKV